MIVKKMLLRLNVGFICELSQWKLNSNVSGKRAARITMRERTKLCWLEAILVCVRPAHWSDQVDI